MCYSSAAAKSPMAQFLKSQTPEELWKASLKPEDPLRPTDLATNPFDPAAAKTSGIKAPGTGLVLDLSA